GLGPRVHHVDPAQGLLVTEYLQGEVLGAADTKNPRILSRFCEALRKLHQLSPPGTVPTMVDNVARYFEVLETTKLPKLAGGTVPVSALHEILKDWAAGTDVSAICHNDLLHSNIVDRGDIAFIDWEYASVSDPVFDLATLAHYHEYSDADEQRLLACYYGDADAPRLKRLAQSKIVVELVFTLWLLACRALIDAAILPAYGSNQELLARLSELPSQYAMTA
ncbi:MAG: phosphotransferase, partial [Gammaproteobacteria bacterium]|nr:phosphotransferase [Gammaproteobacteria bacterium]